MIEREEEVCECRGSAANTEDGAGKVGVDCLWCEEHGIIVRVSFRHCRRLQVRQHNNITT